MFPKGLPLGGLLKQAKQVQEKMKEIQNELSGLKLTGEAAGGMVSAVVNGQQELLSVTIKPDLVKEDIEMVEDLVVAAVRQAMDKAKEASQEKLSGLSAGVMPDLSNLGDLGDLEL